MDGYSKKKKRREIISNEKKKKKMEFPIRIEAIFFCRSVATDKFNDESETLNEK